MQNFESDRFNLLMKSKQLCWTNIIRKDGVAFIAGYQILEW